MGFVEWKRWLGELPWSLRWFLVLVLLRPALDTLYFLKSISPFLSPLYIVGVLTPVAIVASFYARSFPKAYRSGLDPALGAWGWFLCLNSLVMVAFFASPDSLELGLKITAPVFLYFFCRHLVRSRRDLIGLLTTFLYSTAVPFGMLLYERLVSPLGALVLTRQHERYGGLYADVVSYALYAVGAMIVVCYFFLAQPPYAKFRTHIFRLVLVGSLFVLTLMSVHHAASYGVAGAILALLIVHSVGSGRFAIPVIVLFAVGLGVILVGDTITERVEVMFKTDMAVLSGEAEVDAAFHGRMSRWELYLDYWEDMPVAAKLFGASLSGANQGTLRTMMMGGIHSDYLRVMFASGVVGLVLYLGFYGGLLVKAFQALWTERFLILVAVAVVLMYSITILPTLYAPLMYLGLPIFAYAALPRHVLKETEGPTARGGPAGAPTVRRPRPTVPAPAERLRLGEPRQAPSTPPGRVAGEAVPRPGRGTIPEGQRRVRSARPHPSSYRAPYASHDARIEAVLDEVLYRGIVDWVMASEIAAMLREHGVQTEAEVRALTLRVIEAALHQGLVRVGDMNVDGFKAWRGGGAELVARVAQHWPDGLDLYRHDVCWIDLTKSGLARGQRVNRQRQAALSDEVAHAE